MDRIPFVPAPERAWTRDELAALAAATLPDLGARDPAVYAAAVETIRFIQREARFPGEGHDPEYCAWAADMLKRVAS